MPLKTSLSFALAVFLFVLGGCGCTSKTRTFQTITVRASDSLLDPATGSSRYGIDVDLVGVAEGDPLLRVPVDRYFREYSGPFQASNRAKRFRFGPNQPAAGALASSDPVWQNWQSNRYLGMMVIVSRLPDISDPTAGGDVDLRRTVISIDQCDWEGRVRDLTITVSGAEVGYTPRENPRK